MANRQFIDEEIDWYISSQPTMAAPLPPKTFMGHRPLHNSPRTAEQLRGKVIKVKVEIIKLRLINLNSGRKSLQNLYF